MLHRAGKEKKEKEKEKEKESEENMKSEVDNEMLLNERPNAFAEDIYYHHLVNSFSPVSSSSVSNGFGHCEAGLPHSASYGEPKYETPTNSCLLWVDSQLSDDSLVRNKIRQFDRLPLSANYQGIDAERNCFSRNEHAPMAQNWSGSNTGGCAPDWSSLYYGSHEGSDCNAFDYGGFQSSNPTSFYSNYMNWRLLLPKEYREGNLMGTNLFDNQSTPFLSGPSVHKRPEDYIVELGNKLRGIQLQSPSTSKPCLREKFVWSQQPGPLQHGIDSNIHRGPPNPLTSSHLMQPQMALNSEYPLCSHGVTRAIPNGRVSQSLLSPMRGDVEALGCEDSFIIQGKNMNYVLNHECDGRRAYKKNSRHETPMPNLVEKGQEVNCQSYSRRTCGSGQTRSSAQEVDCHLYPRGNCGSGPSPRSYCSLAEVQGCIYSLAKDQDGCLFLQTMCNKGTFEDVHLIFNEIINHVVELMQNPFGNYLIQKLLDVCNEDQRTQIVHALTEIPGELVTVSLNVHGTRVVQKLVETLKTRQQISLVVCALEPGFLDLIKDLNGNHVLIRCLQHLKNEDIKFIFDTAAKFCIDIATHQHGCCVLQKCIARSTGEHRENLVAEISANGLILAQDSYGNYVIQYIIELNDPFVIASLISQFEGNYVSLSTQKFSSHVVEKCLKHIEESRSRIIQELLSVSHFDRLMQDPFANYVIQSALEVTKGSLRAALVEAVRPYMFLRTSPYCKKIISRTLLK